MQEQLYLVFGLNNCLYGIRKDFIEEIFELPELTLIPQAPRNIVGVVNVRGNSLPIMDLNVRLDHQSSDYRLTDNVVVLKWKDLRAGIIVNEVHEFKIIAPEEIKTELFHPQKSSIDTQKRIIYGIVRDLEDILILSNPENWLLDTEFKSIFSLKDTLQKELQREPELDNFPPNGSNLVSKQNFFCPNATPEERVIFQKRAEFLKQSPDRQDLKSLKPLAVIALNRELFGIDLTLVREFTEIHKVTPIPCCPVHIIGNMNLRGEILTLVDIRRLLNLPLSNIPNGSKSMIVEVEGIVAGVMVEEVCDVMFLLNPQEIRPIPTAIHSINSEYLQGIAPYQEKMMNLLNLQKLFFKSGFIVDEAI
ncbi:MAG: chemotaxis protein CheW [Coleofasciculus sp. S288]|nr:chemotaxis protein CheW [Coleofasciculus sp. S288]